MSKYKVRKVEVNPPVVETAGEAVPDLAGLTETTGTTASVIDVTITDPLDDLTAPPTTLELCTPAEAPDFPTVPLATATTEQIIAELKDRGYYGVELRS